MAVAVISGIGKKLMPTSEYKARKLLRSGRAEIYKYKPVFTIRLKDRKEGATQPVEYSSDTGKYHVGVSIKSKKREYVSAVYDMLKDEKETQQQGAEQILRCEVYRYTNRESRKRSFSFMRTDESKGNAKF